MVVVAAAVVVGEGLQFPATARPAWVESNRARDCNEKRILEVNEGSCGVNECQWKNAKARGHDLGFVDCK